jgi:subtilisin family serine protease
MVQAIARLAVTASVVATLLLLPAAMRSEREGTSGRISSTDAVGSHEYKEGELLVRFHERIPESEVIARLAGDGIVGARRFQVTSRPESPNNRLYLVRLAGDLRVAEALRAIASRDDVEIAQPNFIHHKAEVPDDPYFSHQWGHMNTGVSPLEPVPVPALRGPDMRLAGADMKTLEAYDAIAAKGWTADEIIVGVIDTGVDWSHEDLDDIIWTNPGEVAGNGADDDGNGWVDDIHGWDHSDDDNDPTDEDGHGTHVAGAIAAITNNAKGVSGVAKNVKIMPLRFLGPSGGTTADAIDAINYAVANGAKVLNNSWGGGGYETALQTAIEDARAAGVTFVAAAGNEASDNDHGAYYPSSYPVSNVLSVAASSPWGELADFSDTGSETVHSAAPGDEIASTTPATIGTLDPDGMYSYQIPYWYPDYGAYVPWGGTSMAAPAVSGAVALVYGLGEEIWPAAWLTWTLIERLDAVRNRIFDTAEPWPDYHGRVATGGHLNLLNLVESDATAPASVTDLQVLSATSFGVTMRFTATGDDGLDGRANRYDLRYEEAPLWTTFENAIPVRGSWRPRDPGMFDYVTVTGLSPGTDYQFQLAVVDNVGNSSSLSPVVTATAPVAWLETWSDDMEGGPGGWTTQSNQPVEWQQTSPDAHSPITSWTDSAGGDYPSNLNSSLISPVIDLTPAGAVRLDFWQSYDIEAGSDFGYVEATANGVDWDRLLTVTGTHPVWARTRLDLTRYVGGTVQIRFRLQTDPLGNRDGWHIDDVAVRSSIPPPDLLLFEDTFDAPGNWDPGPGDWDLEAGGLSDSPGGDYANLNVSSARLVHPIHLETMEAAVVSFDIAAMEYQDGYDFLYLQVSTDGEWWRSLRRWTGTPLPYREHVDLSEFAGFPEIWLRFRLSTSPEVTGGGVIIDNLRVEGISMPDGDGDGMVDPYDCAPGDGGSFALPTEIRNLRWQPDGIRLEWDSEAFNCGPAVVYDVLRGWVDELPFGSGGAGAICLADSTSDNFVDEHSAPDPGQSLCYLVRGANACGTSSYGVGSIVGDRDSSVCP